MLTSLYPHDSMAIVQAVHQNPHRVLGIHQVEVPMGGERRKILSIRTFCPDARKVVALETSGDASWEMERIHDAGLFEVLIWDRSEKFPYRFEIEDRYGHKWTVEDPYAQWVEELTPFDRYLFNRSMHYKIYEKMGAHARTIDDREGVFFSCWAPNATRVSVIGDFNNWDGRRDAMELLSDSGVWVLFKPGLATGALYKFEIKGASGEILKKSDPYAFYSQLRPETASIVYTLEDYRWQDQEWIERRSRQEALDRPISIYEVHAGSWRKEEGRCLTYRELAAKLLPYVKDMGFTHIELMPIEEHPFDGSWGYQVTGYFAPTSRFGEPHDLQYFVDSCHAEGVGVILDWVPGHFPKDAHGLANFDGTALYEHQDPRQGEHPEWGTKIFNFGRHEVKNFLISNALYWIDKFHFDGLRVDAVASILYLDYSRKEGQWVPNAYGGKENLDAVEFMKHLNSIMLQYFPGAMMVAEESTSWPAVSRPTYMGGLGFGFKWNMGWMNDILSFVQKDPIHRKYHYRQLTFGLLYAWNENFILPFSHDEVVHGKGSLLSRMPGDEWQKFANLRALYTFMWGHPGKKLLFMGQEFGQVREWNHETSLDWSILDQEMHRGVQNCVRDLNALYQANKAFWERDFVPAGFDGIHCDDYDNTMISFLRRGKDPSEFLIFVVNFTPIPRDRYLLGVPEGGSYREVFNSNLGIYGGTNAGNAGVIRSKEKPAYGKPHSVEIYIPPLAGLILKPCRE